MKIQKLARWVSAAGIALSGCQLGNPGTAVALPTGSLTGYVVSGGPVAGASVSVLGPGGVLGTTRTDDSGRFSLPVQSLDATIEVVANGGSYAGAGGANVASGVLRAAVPYLAGGAASVAVTPITTAVVAAEGYFQGQGLGAGAAYARADGAFADWLGFDPETVGPVLPGDGGATQTLTAGLRYGLVLAAFSRWAHENGSRTQAATSLMAGDVAYDGILNGVGAAGALTLGSLALSADAYRQGLADALLQAAASAPAGSADALPGPNAAALLAYARALTTSTSPIFGSAAPPALASGALTLSMAPLPAWTHGTITVGGSVTDPYGLPVTVAIAVDQQQYQTVTATSAFGFSIDTNALSDGLHTLSVSAQDAAGGQASYEGSLGVDNTPPQACVTVFQPVVNGALVAGRWQDISGVTAGTADGTALTISPGVWEADVPAPLPSPFVLSLTDAAGNQRSYSWALGVGSNPAPCS